MMRVFDVETFLTWAHYTLWIILYPMAFLCEGHFVSVAENVILTMSFFHRDPTRIEHSSVRTLEQTFLQSARVLQLPLLHAFRSALFSPDLLLSQ